MNQAEVEASAQLCRTGSRPSEEVKHGETIGEAIGKT